MNPTQQKTQSAQQEILQASRRAQIWARREAGEPIYRIAAAIGCSGQSIERVLDATGGIRPPPRRRAARTLATHEREVISRGLAAGLRAAQIARELGRHRSTIGREVRRNGGRRTYRAHQADARARRPKRCKLAQDRALCRYVIRQLSRHRWSPQQIALRLARRYGSDHARRVSHETIYRTLFVQSRGVFRRELTAYLRTQRVRRRARHAQPCGARQSSLGAVLSIRERPAEAEDRAVPGHWEGDLLCGKAGTQVATLVERRSRFLLLIKLDSKNSVHVADRLAQRIRRLPAALKRSVTWDRGIEMASHARFTVATDVQIYFCDPQSPWQRGSNENTNGLLREYLPKGSDFSAHSQAQLNRIAHELNTRPRATLDGLMPIEVLNQTLVAATP